MSPSLKDKFNLGGFYSKKSLSEIINEPNLKLVREGLYYCKNSNSTFYLSVKSGQELVDPTEDYIHLSFFAN